MKIQVGVREEHWRTIDKPRIFYLVGSGDGTYPGYQYDSPEQLGEHLHRLIGIKHELVPMQNPSDRVVYVPNSPQLPENAFILVERPLTHEEHSRMISSMYHDIRNKSMGTVKDPSPYEGKPVMPIKK